MKESYFRIQIDATYNLLWGKYRVVIIGSSDANKKFYPFGASVTTHKRHFDFKFLFQGLWKKFIGDWTSRQKSTSLQADCTAAITNGWHEAGYVGIRDSCWFHLKKNNKKPNF